MKEPRKPTLTAVNAGKDGNVVDVISAAARPASQAPIPAVSKTRCKRRAIAMSPGSGSWAGSNIGRKSQTHAGRMAHVRSGFFYYRGAQYDHGEDKPCDFAILLS